jgi:hypothetical protein
MLTLSSLGGYGVAISTPASTAKYFVLQIKIGEAEVEKRVMV